MYSVKDHAALPAWGFPIRIPADISTICVSPQLFAAYRVLLRPSVPWHPPCALVRLIFAVLLRPPKTVEAEQDTVVVLLLSFPCAVFKMRLKTLFRFELIP